MSALVNLAESAWLPDVLVRAGIRRLVRQRLRQSRDDDSSALIQILRQSQVALHTDRANEQHYEVPPAFFRRVLGGHLKYSAGYWPRPGMSLTEAEESMLALYAERAELADGQHILDLGCGWGSFTLWAAERFPRSTFVAVSNAQSQRRYIESELARRQLGNVRVLTEDVNRLSLQDAAFDLVVSVEMFEHVRNYAELLQGFERWLKADGKLFVHIFCHRYLAYPFETAGDDNWMGRYFFTGGLMPAADTLLHFQDDLRLEQRWSLPGSHYQRTARAWLDNLDADRHAVREVLRPVYGDDDAQLWVQRWRMFFMACEELFGYRQGREWLVCHYRFAPRCRNNEA
jgi:cyclopropane-fatty-acyl-phospholipid synthase